MTEPIKTTAGFSESWEVILTDYSTAAFTLTYTIRKADGSGSAVTFQADLAGPFRRRVNLPPGLTAGMVGVYQLTGYITDDETGGQIVRKVIYEGSLEIQPDPLTQGGDRRSFYRRMVDVLRKAMLDLSEGTLSSTSVNGKTYSRRQLAEVRQELARFEELLANEEGRGRSQKIFARFLRPGF